MSNYVFMCVSDYIYIYMYIYFVGSSAALKQSPAGKEALSSTDSKPTLDSSVAGSTGGAAKKTTYARLQEDWSLFLELTPVPPIAEAQRQLRRPRIRKATFEMGKNALELFACVERAAKLTIQHEVASTNA